MIELGPNRYGKSAIRLVKVVREGSRHAIRDLTLDVALEGDFVAAHVDGDNAHVVATDTMKNTVHAFADKHLTSSIERFGHVLVRHFLGFEQVARATVSISEHRWVRLPTETGAADDAFLRSGDYTRIATVSGSPGDEIVEAGIRDLTVLKTTRSAFSGFPRDRYTTLPETEDRLMATRLTAVWRYRTPVRADHDALFDAIGATLLHLFAEHHSPSVQASAWTMGRAVLERHPEVDEVRLSLPNLHHWLVDLSPFGLDNRNTIFTPTTEPHGLIEATVRRSD